MKNLKGLLVFLVAGFSATASFAVKVKPGDWYTSFKLRDNVYLPVIFTYEKGKTPGLIIHNGEERISLTQIRVQNDSLFASFPAFDSELKMQVHHKNYISGAWYNRAKSNSYSIPFTSVNNGTSRYPINSDQQNIGGKWEVTFDYKKDPEKSVGIFTYLENTAVKTNILHGTFLTETGDYRFLEGATIGDSLYLSCFDGSHAFLFRARLKEDTLWGDFHSGTHYRTDWMAVRNEQFELRNPDSLTYLVNQNPISFELPKLDGSMYKYPNETHANKVVLIQIMGTWCPNCLDESNYLKGIYAMYHDQLEIIAVTFETQKTLEEKIIKVSKYKEALGLDYTFLIGGDACKPCASEVFPQLNEVLSFPTLIFIDKKGTIRKIHTGFSGPGTGEYYLNFKTETSAFIELLVNE